MISPALNYLRAREWASWYDEPGPLDLCTECGALRRDGHQSECQMRAAIASLEAAEPLMDALASIPPSHPALEAWRMR